MDAMDEVRSERRAAYAVSGQCQTHDLETEVESYAKYHIAPSLVIIAAERL